jgi:hypothetical protein
MIATRVSQIALLTLLLSGCSAAMLEDAPDIANALPPRACTETTRLFNTFTMRATRVAWKADKGDANATLTVDLKVDNDKNFPIALSNSGNGVLYTVQFTLQGDKGGSITPKETTGVALTPPPKEFKEPKRPGAFGYVSPPKKPNDVVVDNTRDVNFHIKPGEPETATLIFQAPRQNYMLTIERKFADKPLSGHPTDHLAACKISAG